MNIDFIELIKKSFQLTWKYKILWLFGLIIAFTSGGGGGGNNRDTSNSNYSNYGGTLSESEITKYQDQVASFMSNPGFWVAVVAISLIVLVLAILFWYLRVNSEYALYRAYMYDKIAQPEKIGFMKLWGEGGKRTLFVMLMEFLYAIALVVISIPMIVLVIILAIVPFTLCCTIPVYFLIVYAAGVSLAIAKNLYINYNFGFFESIKESLRIMRKNIVNIIVLLLTFILFVIIIFVPVMIIGITLAIPLLLAIGIIFTMNNIVLQVLLVILIVLVISILYGIVTAPVYTFTYMYNIGFADKAKEIADVQSTN